MKFNNDAVRFHHSEYKKGKPRYTLASFLDADSKTFLVGMARCYAKDNFCRKTGREVATKRLLGLVAYANNCGTPIFTPFGFDKRAITVKAIEKTSNDKTYYVLPTNIFDIVEKQFGCTAGKNHNETNKMLIQITDSIIVTNDK